MSVNLNNNNNNMNNNKDDLKVYKDIDCNVNFTRTNFDEMQKFKIDIENAKNIPEELKQLKQWVVRKTKLPFQINGHPASSSDPKTWDTYQNVNAFRDQFDGIGFVFSEDNDIMGVDFDHIIDENGVWDKEALEEILSLHSYAEISPSGTGAHVLVKATIPVKGRKNQGTGREMYQYDRYFTVTGNHIEGTPKIINKMQEPVNILYKKWFPEKETPKYTVSSIVSNTDSKIIEIAGKSKNADKFNALYQGNWQGLYPSQSEADSAFCFLLAFYTQDKVQIDNIYRSSGLYREKWNRQDYRDEIINKAVNSLTATYNWNKNNNEVIIEIPEHNFKFTITFNKKYQIKIQDINKIFTCNKPLIEYNKNRDTQLTEFITKNTGNEKDTAKILVDKLGELVSGKYFSQIEALKSKIEKKENNEYLGMIVPYPYVVKNGNLYIQKLIKNGDEYEEIEEYISRAFTVKSYGELKDKGEFEGYKNIVLEFENIDGNIITKTVDINNILDPNGQKENLQVLAIVGLKRAEFINYYLSVVENNIIPIAEITKIGGWKDNYTKYVAADATYGEGNEYGLISNQSMENVHKKGTFNDWIEGTYELLNDDVYAFVNYSGVCALIQQYLGIPNFNILYISKTSVGKSTSAKVRSSGFGHPHHMMTTSNASKQGIPNVIYGYNDAPCHLDEIKDKDVDMLNDFLYDISGGQKRIRANKTGGVNNTKNDTFNTNIICTTEQPILDISAKGGEHSRVIIIRKIPKVSLSSVNKFEEKVCNKNGIAKTYGHCLELYVSKVIEMIHNGTLKLRFNEIKKELQTINIRNSNMVNRFVEYYAGIALAGEIFNLTIVNHPENRGRIKALNAVEITKDIMQAHINEEPDKSEGTRAMEVFMDSYNVDRFKFNEPQPIKYYNKDTESMEEREQKISFYGYNNDKDVIQVYSKYIKDVLTKSKFKYETILTEWKEEGYIITRGKRNTSQKKFSSEHQKITGKQNFPCVEIIKDKVRHLMDEGVSNTPINNNSIIEDFCKERLHFDNSLNQISLKDIYENYINWCDENSLIPISMIALFGKIIIHKPNASYDQIDANDLNSIIFNGIQFISIPKKLNLSLSLDEEISS